MRPIDADKILQDTSSYEEVCDVLNAIRKAPTVVPMFDSLQSLGEIAKFSEIVEQYGINHLYELVEAEKDGRLAAMPCKAGDTVWAVTSPINVPGMDSNEEQLAIFECSVESISLYASTNAQFRLYYRGEFVAWYVTIADFGKTVFLTREEAEAVLKRQKNDNRTLL